MPIKYDWLSRKIYDCPDDYPSLTRCTPIGRYKTNTREVLLGDRVVGRVRKEPGCFYAVRPDGSEIPGAWGYAEGAIVWLVREALAG